MSTTTTELDRLLYTAEAVSTGDGRNGHVASSDGRIDADLAMPPALGGSGEGINPEQLFASGYAACFHSALRLAARRERLQVEGSTVTAQVSIGTQATTTGSPSACRSGSPTSSRPRLKRSPKQRIKCAPTPARHADTSPSNSRSHSNTRIFVGLQAVNLSPDGRSSTAIRSKRKSRDRPCRLTSRVTAAGGVRKATQPRSARAATRTATSENVPSRPCSRPTRLR